MHFDSGTRRVHLCQTDISRLMSSSEHFNVGPWTKGGNHGDINAGYHVQCTENGPGGESVLPASSHVSSFDSSTLDVFRGICLYPCSTLRWIFSLSRSRLDPKWHIKIARGPYVVSGNSCTPTTPRDRATSSLEDRLRIISGYSSHNGWGPLT